MAVSYGTSIYLITLIEVYNDQVFSGGWNWERYY